MVKEMSISEARNELTALAGRLARQPGAVAITRRGKPVLAVISWDVYESLVETLEIMSDPELMKALRQSLKELKTGKLKSWAKVKAELDL